MSVQTSRDFGMSRDGGVTYFLFPTSFKGPSPTEDSFRLLLSSNWVIVSEVEVFLRL